MNRFPRLLQISACLSVLIFDGAANVVAAEEPHFCYDDTLECGPSHWGDLADEWATCQTGTQQSPIDIGRAREDERLTDIRFNWKPTPLVIKNNGHTLQVNYPPGSSIRVNRVTYHLLQFHFHAPSEHTVDGMAEAMEVHMVHVSDEGILAVVGVMLEAGSVHRTLDKVLQNAPEEGEEVEIPGVTVNAKDFLPEDRTYWTYAGSLTTPPCSEGVRWHVLHDRRSVSADQAAEFEHLFHGSTARPVQPLNDRTIRTSED